MPSSVLISYSPQHTSEDDPPYLEARRHGPILAVRVVGDAAPAPGRCAQHQQQQGEDDGDKQPQKVERRLIIFLAATQLAHVSCYKGRSDEFLVGWG